MKWMIILLSEGFSESWDNVSISFPEEQNSSSVPLFFVDFQILNQNFTPNPNIFFLFLVIVWIFQRQLQKDQPFKSLFYMSLWMILSHFIVQYFLWWLLRDCCSLRLLGKQCVMHWISFIPVLQISAWLCTTWFWSTAFIAVH